MNDNRRYLILAVAAVAAIGVGCAKKKVASQTPAPPVVAESRPAAVAGNTPSRPVSGGISPSGPSTTAQTPARMPNAETRARIDTLLGRIEDAYFDYDQHSLRADAIQALSVDSKELRDILKDYPDYKLTIEGHADERGSAEYNLALGQERADAAKAYLVQVGIPNGQLGTVTYGKAKPACEEHDEACWQKNRRVHIVAASR